MLNKIIEIIIDIGIITCVLMLLVFGLLYIGIV